MESRWWFQIFFIFTPNLGEMESNLTSIFFKRVVEPSARNLHLEKFTMEPQKKSPNWNPENHLKQTSIYLGSKYSFSKVYNLLLHDIHILGLQPTYITYNACFFSDVYLWLGFSDVWGLLGSPCYTMHLRGGAPYKMGTRKPVINRGRKPL